MQSELCSSHSAERKTRSLLVRAGQNNIRQMQPVKPPNPLLSKISFWQKCKARRNSEVITHMWLTLIENVFQHFWGGVDKIMKFGECVTIAKSDGCNVRNSIQKGILYTLPFKRNLTLTSNPLLANGLQNQWSKSIHSQMISERYWTLYI